MRDSSPLLSQWSKAFDIFHKIFKSDWERHGAVVCMLLLTVIITETAPLHQVRSYIYVAFHIIYCFHLVLFWQQANNPSLDQVIHSTQPNHQVWYEAVQNHYKQRRRHASEVSPAHSRLYRVYTPVVIHHSFIHLGTCCLGYLNGWCSCVLGWREAQLP